MKYLFPIIDVLKILSYLIIVEWNDEHIFLLFFFFFW